MKNIIKSITVLSLLVTLTGCAYFQSELNSLHGSITGNTYRCEFYSNSGEKFMTAIGQNIDINANVVEEKSYNSDSGWGYTEALSSVMSITIDGNQMESCGSTILFIENGLEPDVDFKLASVQNINSEAHGLGDYAFVANIVNEYKNAFGKKMVVVIQSQLGDPICAFSGDRVYWEVCQDLPKTTKLMIDGHALYIHRANFQLIDKDLLT